MLRGAVRRVGPRSSWRRRPFSSVAADDHPELGSLPLAQPAACVWGSNTGVGKTLFSAGLAAACRRAGVSRSAGTSLTCSRVTPAVPLQPTPTHCSLLALRLFLPADPAAVGSLLEACADGLPRRL